MRFSVTRSSFRPGVKLIRRMLSKDASEITYSSSHTHGSGKWGPGRCVESPNGLYFTEP